jgi:hypothetical protein
VPVSLITKLIKKFNLGNAMAKIGFKNTKRTNLRKSNVNDAEEKLYIWVMECVGMLFD